MSKLIILDAGHGGRDPGALSTTGRRESDDNLRFCLALEPVLVRQGFRVEQTRREDVFVSVNDRWAMANRLNADLFYSQHRNSAQRHDANGRPMFNPNGSPVLNTAAHGVENWIRNNPSAQSRAIAEAVLEEWVRVGVQANRGIRMTGNFGILNNARMPATMTELGFMPNERDNQLFDQNFDRYVEGAARGICEFFGVPFNGEEPRQRARISLASYVLPEQEAQMRKHLAQIRAIPGFEDAWPVITDLE